MAAKRDWKAHANLAAERTLATAAWLRQRAMRTDSAVFRECFTDNAAAYVRKAHTARAYSVAQFGPIVPRIHTVRS